jgi:hypothetical protein
MSVYEFFPINSQTQNTQDIIPMCVSPYVTPATAVELRASRISNVFLTHFGFKIVDALFTKDLRQICVVKNIREINLSFMQCSMAILYYLYQK